MKEMSDKTRKYISYALIALVALFYIKQFAKALPDMFDKLIPGTSMEPIYDPLKTMRAQFIDEKAFSAAGAIIPFNPDGDEAGLGELAKIHRTPAEVGKWLEEVISELMNFNSLTYQDHIKAMEKELDQTAITQFQEFVTNGRILESMKSSGMQMGSHVEERPLVINKGIVAGRYHWLFDIPVLISFMPDQIKEYKKFTPAGQHLILTVQVGRVARETNADELMMESFSIRKNPYKTPEASE